MVAARRLVAVGVDWARDDHAVCVIDADGEPVERVTVAHTRAGLARLVGLLARFEVAGVGIERPDGPVVDVLLAAGVSVFVIAPAQIKSLRRRYGSAGNKDDRFDAYVLADTVRTDRRRLTALQPDSPATLVLRALSRARKDLVGHRVAVANQLRAHLQTVLPGMVGLFHAIDGPVSRAFIAQFSIQDAVDRLTVEDLAGWLHVHNSHRSDPQRMHQRLRAATRGPVGGHGRALAGVTRAYLAALTAIVEQISELEEQLADALAAHPDRHVFTSLPRSGTVRAARLLAEIGDARGRFPTAAALAGLAGVTPSTRQSGQVRVVAFRWAVDKELRGGGLRLRRRLPPRQPLGAAPLPAGQSPRPPPPTRRQNPRPSLARRHLEALDHRHRLRPSPPQRPPNPPTTRSNRDGLTQDTPVSLRSGPGGLPARPRVVAQTAAPAGSPPRPARHATPRPSRPRHPTRPPHDPEDFSSPEQPKLFRITETAPAPPSPARQTPNSRSPHDPEDLLSPEQRKLFRITESGPGTEQPSRDRPPSARPT
ncbi:IS110 family transposase [Dactylosporangium sp. NPDC049742]|uniref:IS110 family transposase n=1 Tax=Dactylosporangium sp. NPDC049742 TaxID=3154737 RepID=UPI00342E5BDB